MGGGWGGRRTADQLFRCATSVAANYRAAARSRSPEDFIAGMGLVVEEADESGFWLEFIPAAGIDAGPEIAPLAREADELLAIFNAVADDWEEERAQKGGCAPGRTSAGARVQAHAT